MAAPVLPRGHRAAGPATGPARIWHLSGSRRLRPVPASVPRVSDEIPALPTACPRCRDEPGRRAPEVLFVGAFSERKGVRQLLAAWPLVRQRHPTARLRVLGKGPLVSLVEAAAAADATIAIELDPPRARVHGAFEGSKVAVLLSQPWRGWREQVGLPIVEALTHGCEVVASDQTGLAGWLRAHGHRVLETPATADDVAAAIVSALESDRATAARLSQLPGEDGRLQANHWLFGGSAGVIDSHGNGMCHEQ